MAHIEDRWYKTVVVDDRNVQVPKTTHGKGMRYRVRYIGPDGRERSESFPDRRKRDASAFLAQVQADILKGTYVDPDAGRVTFRKYADEWLSAASCDESTRERLERQFRLHVYPVFGDRPIAAVQPNTIRAWAKQLQDSGMAASYRRNLFNDVSMILNAAVDDRKVISNPCALKTVRAPRYVPAKVVPWSTERLASFRAVMRERYRIAVDLGAGCGLRQGEIFAVSPDDVDTSRRLLHVVRQVKIVRGTLVFAPPKGGKLREVPLPDAVAARLREHADQVHPVPVTLPWGTPDGVPRTVTVYLSTANGDPVSRPSFNANVWKPAIRAAGVEDTRQNGMHVLRHTYASVLLDAGENIKALSLYLGHADPGFTLRVYTHLLPTSEERTRRAIDTAFGHGPATPDGLATA
ncbi:tyrosine-type recombinase/integrase [Micromonospora sp. WMMD708]|uniref:tyrosine-type recombinase/integrase n=1 Tax=Micromonospora sp. WMMD708 TaxID=3403464 RepID=UPI003BF4D9DE